MNRQIEKGISEIVGVFTDPIIVSPGGWGDTLPDWLREAITLERLVMNIKGCRGEETTGTDAEACAYLYTRSLEAPMDHDWAKIYLYVAGKCMRAWQKQKAIPEDIKVDELDRNQMDDLIRLKEWIYHRKSIARLDRDRAERRERKEEEVAKKEAEQPALFGF